MSGKIPTQPGTTFLGKLMYGDEVKYTGPIFVMEHETPEFRRYCLSNGWTLVMDLSGYSRFGLTIDVLMVPTPADGRVGHVPHTSPETRPRHEEIT